MNNKNSTVISCRNLSKNFGKVAAIEGINLDVKEGSVFGLLGPNGAGKTTFIRCVCKLIKASEGEIFYRGKLLSFQDIYSNFGYLPEHFIPPGELNAKEFLDLFSLSLGISSQRAGSFLDEVELDKKKKIKYYSRGMVQRLGLAVAFLKDPDLIILDEPTLGLDPVAQSKILSLLGELNRKGKTIFFSSHNLFQVEKICDEIGVINLGKISFTGRIKDFLNKHAAGSLDEAFLKEVS